MCSSLLMITCSYSAHRRLQVYRAEKQELQIRWGQLLVKGGLLQLIGAAALVLKTVLFVTKSVRVWRLRFRCLGVCYS